MFRSRHSCFALSFRRSRATAVASVHCTPQCNINQYVESARCYAQYRTAYPALVEPNLEASGPQRLADTAGRSRVLRGIADEDCLHSAAQGVPALTIVIIPRHCFALEWSPMPGGLATDP